MAENRHGCLEFGFVEFLCSAAGIYVSVFFRSAADFCSQIIFLEQSGYFQIHILYERLAGFDGEILHINIHYWVGILVLFRTFVFGYLQVIEPSVSLVFCIEERIQHGEVE